MTKRLADVAQQGRGQRGDGQPRPQRQARRLRADPPGRPDRPRRPRLRAADQAPRRARPARRPRPARAPEPDLPGVRRGRRRGARPAGLHAGPVHPDRRRRVGGRLRRPAPPAAGLGRRLRRRPVRPGGRAARPLPPPGRARSLPTVLVNAAIDGLGFPRVSCDDAVAVEQAMGHLLSLGHTRIGLLLGPRTTSRRTASWPRRRPSPRSAGVALRPDQIAHSLYSLEAAQAAAVRLLAAGVTGIVCASDPMALGAIRAVRRAGLTVPGDVSVVGFDDSALMNCTDPPLTTVRQPIEPMGRMVIELLVGQIDGRPRPARRAALRARARRPRARPDPAPDRRADRRAPSARPLGDATAIDPRSACPTACAGHCLSTLSQCSVVVQTLSCQVLAFIRRMRYVAAQRATTLPRCVEPVAIQTRRDDVAGRGPHRRRRRPRPSSPATLGVAPPLRRPGLVAQRRHLPGLRPQLRRRQRRRDRRPRRRPLPAPLPARPRRRRHLVHARGTSRRSPTAATTSPTTARSTRPSARSRRPRRSSPRRSTYGIRTIIDVVPNHVSDRHAVVPGGARGRARLARARALLVPPGPRRRRRRAARPAGPRSSTAARPGPARRTRTAPRASGTSTSSRAEQPDLNWDHPDVRARARGDPALLVRPRRRRRADRLGGPAGQGPDDAGGPGRSGPGRPSDPRPRRAPRHLPRAGARSPTPTRARASSSARSGSRTSTGSPATSARTSCTRPSTSTSWPARGMPRACATSIDATLAAHAPVGAPPTWVLSNHDVTRPVTRYGREDTSFAFTRKRFGTPTDRRARPPTGPGGGAPHRRPARLAVHLPGRRARPRRGRASRATRSRTRCTAAPAASTRAATAAASRCRGAGRPPPFGFSPAGATAAPWLSQPAHWAELTVEAAGIRARLHAPPLPGGAALPARRTRPRGRAPRPGSPPTPDVLAFARGADFVNITNLSGAAIPLPPHRAVLLASADVSDGHLPPDATVWLRPDPAAIAEPAGRVPDDD